VVTPAALLGLLAEPDRLRVVAALVLGARTTVAVADAAGVPVPVAARALARLESGGLVSSTAGEWMLLESAFPAAARAMSVSQPEEDLGEADPASAAVLRAFCKDGRLVSIPAARSKRLVVLDRIARMFDIGVRYPEAEVNARLRQVHPDTASLRRHLIDEGFLARESRFYWRTGGTIEI
jgi:hypothetical protein